MHRRGPARARGHPLPSLALTLCGRHPPAKGCRIQGDRGGYCSPPNPALGRPGSRPGPQEAASRRALADRAPPLPFLPAGPGRGRGGAAAGLGLRQVWVEADAEVEVRAVRPRPLRLRRPGSGAWTPSPTPGFPRAAPTGAHLGAQRGRQVARKDARSRPRRPPARTDPGAAAGGCGARRPAGCGRCPGSGARPSGAPLSGRTRRYAGRRGAGARPSGVGKRRRGAQPGARGARAAERGCPGSAARAPRRTTSPSSSPGRCGSPGPISDPVPGPLSSPDPPEGGAVCPVVSGWGQRSQSPPLEESPFRPWHPCPGPPLSPLGGKRS